MRRNSDKTMATDLTLKQLSDAQTNTSDVEEIKDQQRKPNELPGIHRSNRLCLCWKTDFCRAMWRNLREKGVVCTYCGELNEYPMLSTPPLSTPLPLDDISLYFELIPVYFCLFYFWKFIFTCFSHKYYKLLCYNSLC